MAAGSELITAGAGEGRVVFPGGALFWCLLVSFFSVLPSLVGEGDIGVILFSFVAVSFSIL